MPLPDLAGAAKSLWGHSDPTLNADGLQLFLGRPLLSPTCFSKHPWGLLGFVLGRSWLLA
jgi:hypothetical protein